MRPYDIELDIGGLTLEVSGYYTPPTAENKSGHPDTWEPAEGGELEVMEVLRYLLVLQKRRRNLSVKGRGGSINDGTQGDHDRSQAE